MNDIYRLQIGHITHFSYEPGARSSYNEVRMMPMTIPRQTTLTAQVRTRPDARQYRYLDYWGTQVVAFDVPQTHESLEIRGSSVVDTGRDGLIIGATWDELAARAESLNELLGPTTYTASSARTREIADELRQDTPLATVYEVMEWIHDHLVYERGVTGVHSSGLEALEAGGGVCQDFAHLALVMLRQLGIPARYVSGYLHPDPEPEIGEEVAGESHAWIEAWTGEWHEVDPTNLVPVGSRHVVVARGRDYADVPPLKGVYAGGGTDSMRTTVTMTRIRRD